MVDWEVGPMRAVGLIALALVGLSGCRQTTADAVQANYDARADVIDRQAQQQPTSTAKDIYKDQADALREEGKDRAKGIRKAGVDQPVPAQH